MDPKDVPSSDVVLDLLERIRHVVGPGQDAVSRLDALIPLVRYVAGKPNGSPARPMLITNSPGRSSVRQSEQLVSPARSTLAPMNDVSSPNASAVTASEPRVRIVEPLSPSATVLSPQSAIASLEAADESFKRLNLALERQVQELTSATQRLSAVEAEAKALQSRDLLRKAADAQVALGAAQALVQTSRAAATICEQRAVAAHHDVEASARRDVESARGQAQTAKEALTATEALAKAEAARAEAEIATLRSALAASEADKHRVAAAAAMYQADFGRLATVARAVEAREKELLEQLGAANAKIGLLEERVSSLDSDKASLMRQISELGSGAATAVMKAELTIARQRVAELEAAAATAAVASIAGPQSIKPDSPTSSNNSNGSSSGGPSLDPVEVQLELASLRSQVAQYREDLAVSSGRIRELEVALQDADVSATSGKGTDAAAAGLLGSPTRPGAPKFASHVAKVTVAEEEQAKDFASVEQLLKHCRTLGLATTQLVIGVDCTKSNMWTGKASFEGRPLHDVSDPAHPNPYQQVMRIIGGALKDFDDDGLIPLYGFGCVKTRDHSVFNFKADASPCKGVEDVLETYRTVIPTVNLAGPTSFAPLIKKTLETVKKDKQFTVLLVMCDGQVTDVKGTEAAIVEASRYPLAIVCIGVGDGPWEDMKRFDDGLPARKVDNFQFIDLASCTAEAAKAGRPLEEYFALSVLAELPAVTKAMKKARYF